MIVEVFYHLDEVIRKYNGGKPAMGNYSGWGAPSDDPMQVLDIIAEAVNDLGFTDHMVYALDCASSEYYDAEKGLYRWRGDYVDRDFIIDQLAAISRKYPLAFVEDALQEEDFEGFKLASERINTVIVGDDFICTSLDRAEKAVSHGRGTWHDLQAESGRHADRGAAHRKVYDGSRAAGHSVRTRGRHAGFSREGNCCCAGSLGHQNRCAAQWFSHQRL